MRPGVALIEVIELTVTEGRGTDENPNRPVIYYFRPDGTPLARVDKWEEEVRDVEEQIRAKGPGR